MVHSYTGVVTYDVDELDDMKAWMLQLGFIVGCGPDCSFGCGFCKKEEKDGRQKIKPG